MIHANDYEVFVYSFTGPAVGTEFRGDSKTIPEWARFGFVDVLNDGGYPLKVRAQGSTDLYVETGDRIPITGQQELTLSRDQDQALMFANLQPCKLAFLSVDVARVMPPPTKNENDTITAVENVIHAVGSRQLQVPNTARGLRKISVFNLGPITCYLGESSAQATALAVPIAAGMSVDWPTTQLWAKNPDAATDQTLNVAYRIKRF